MHDDLFNFQATKLNPYLKKLDDTIEEMPWIPSLLCCVLLELEKRQKESLTRFNREVEKNPNLSFEFITVSFQEIGSEVCKKTFNLAKDLYWYHHRLPRSNTNPNKISDRLKYVFQTINELIEAEKDLPNEVSGDLKQNVNYLLNKHMLKDINLEQTLLKKPLNYPDLPLKSLAELIGTIGHDHEPSTEVLSELERIKSIVTVKYEDAKNKNVEELEEIKRELNFEMQWLAQRQPEVVRAIETKFSDRLANGLRELPQSPTSVPLKLTPVQLAFWSLLQDYPNLFELLVGEYHQGRKKLKQEEQELRINKKINEALYAFQNQLIHFFQRFSKQKDAGISSTKNIKNIIEKIYQKILNQSKIDLLAKNSTKPEVFFWDSEQKLMTITLHRRLLEEKIKYEITPETDLTKVLSYLERQQKLLQNQHILIGTQLSLIARELISLKNKYYAYFAHDTKTSVELFKKYKNAFIDINSTNINGETFIQIALKKFDVNLIFYIIKIAERQGVILAPSPKTNQAVEVKSTSNHLLTPLNPSRNASYYQQNFHKATREYIAIREKRLSNLHGYFGSLFRKFYDKTILTKERAENIRSVDNLIQYSQEYNDDYLLCLGIMEMIMTMEKGRANHSDYAELLNKVLLQGKLDKQPFRGDPKVARQNLLEWQNAKLQQENHNLQLQKQALYTECNSNKLEIASLTTQFENNVHKLRILEFRLKQSENNAENLEKELNDTKRHSDAFEAKAKKVQLELDNTQKELYNLKKQADSISVPPSPRATRPAYFTSQPINIPHPSDQTDTGYSLFSAPGVRFRK